LNAVARLPSFSVQPFAKHFSSTRSPDGQITPFVNLSLSSPSRKNISVFPKYKSPYMFRHPTPLEGRIMIVAYAGWGCGGRKAALRTKAL
jgi:hypothetical protein